MKIIFMLGLIIFSFAANAQDSIKISKAKDSSNIISDDDDITFTKTEVEAQYPGGQPAWGEFLKKNMHYPDKAISNEIQGTITVQFIIDKEGNVTNVIAVSGPTTGGLREECIRLIKLSGKWTPAMQNGRQVKAYKKQPFIFKLSVK